MLNKYSFLTELRARYPQLEHLDLRISEAGYLMRHPEMHPAQIVFADHHGAAQYALRLIAYAEMNEIMTAPNNFALSTGSRRKYYDDDTKAPVFNALRVQRDMAELCTKEGLPLSSNSIPPDCSISNSNTDSMRLPISRRFNDPQMRPADGAGLTGASPVKRVESSCSLTGRRFQPESDCRARAQYALYLQS